MSNRFRSIGGSTVFKCTICTRNTRMTTQDDDRFCGECFELLSIQNALWDDGVEEFRSWKGPALRDKLIAKIAKLKGSDTAVRANMPDLFAA